jgi:hypothetical protein
MCVYSMILDHYKDKWSPWTQSAPAMPAPLPLAPRKLPSQAEIDEFRILLDRAREYDRRTGQPDCELEEKRQTIRDLADKLGVKIDFV